MVDNYYHMIFGTSDITENAEEIAKESADKVNIIRQYIDEMLPKLLSFGGRVVLAFIVIAIGSRVIGAVRSHFRKRLLKGGVQEGVVQFVDSLMKFILYFLLILMILSRFGITTGTVVAILGSSGLTLGLALQGALSNFAGGVLILIQKPFAVGDYIREDTHGNEGVVIKITMIYTTLETVDKKLVVVPNGVLANTSLVNYTGQDGRLIDISVGVAYDSDLEKAKKVLFEVAKNSPYITEDGKKNINIFVSALAESEITMGLRFNVPVKDYWPARWKTLEDTRNALREANIEIPFRQLAVWNMNQADGE